MSTKNKIVALCFFAAIFSPIGIDIYIALMPNITKIYSQNAEFALSSFILGMGVATLISGALYDKFGGKKLLTGASVALIINSLILAQVNSFESLVILRFFQGIVISPFILAALAIVKDSMEPAEVGPIFGKINGFMNLMPMTMPMVSLMLLEYTGSWKSIFIFMVVLTIIFYAFLEAGFKKDEIKFSKGEKTKIKGRFKKSRNP